MEASPGGHCVSTSTLPNFICPPNSRRTHIQSCDPQRLTRIFSPTNILEKKMHS
jgi:hypothetical protein